MTMCLMLAAAATAVEICVSPQGDDAAAGTAAAPLKTVAAALRKAENAASGAARTIRLMSGTYRLDAPLRFGYSSEGLTVRADVPGRAILSGAVPVTGWKRDPSDKRLLVAPVPYALSERREFLTLVVGTNACPIAAVPGYGNPERGFLRTTAVFKAALKQGGGGFEPKPTDEELTTLPVDRSTLPAGVDLAKVDYASAWVDLWHMWSDSPCAVTSNNAAKGILFLEQKPVWPPGMLNNIFELVNLREGLQEPGEWCLDRKRKEIVYFPRKGETPENIEASLSHLHSLAEVSNASRLTLKGLVFEGASAPFQNAGFGGPGLTAAFSIRGSHDLTLDGVQVRHVSGVGMKASGDRLAILNCDIGFTGGSALTLSGSENRVENTRLHDTGTSTHAAAICSLSGKELSVVGNKMWNAPYCGIILTGQHHLLASNEVWHVMRVLQDGGALYGGYDYCVIRDNYHHDLKALCFKGYGQSGYYADEGSHDNLFTGNRSENIGTAIHNHITRNNIHSNNVYIADGDLHVSFANSINGTFVDNACYYLGKFTYGEPAGYGEFARNRMFRGKKAGQPLRAYVKDGDGNWDLQPEGPSKPVVSLPVKHPPKFDGRVERDEWPLQHMCRLSKDDFGCHLGGSPTTLRVCHDKETVYLLLEVSYYSGNGERPTIGNRWGRHDGARFEFGKDLVVTLHSDATCECSDPALKMTRGDTYAVTVGPRVINYEFSLPFSALGRNGPTDKPLPFNVTTYFAQFDEYRCLDAPSLKTPVPGSIVFSK